MMNEWKEVKLGEVCRFQNGYAFKSSEFDCNGDYKIVKIKELKDGKVQLFNDTSKVMFDKKYSKYLIYNNDILFALTGDPVSKKNPLSWVGRVSKNYHNEQLLLNQRVCKTIPNTSRLYNDFIYYFFIQYDELFRLASKASGSASQANISTKTLESTNLSLPPLPEQKAIADTLSCLDDKIELNNKINKNLEAQAQAIFKSWFVDFEPFQDGEFVDSEMGRIPKGWRVGTLGEVADIFAGGDKPKKCSQTYTEQYNIPIYSNGTTDEGLYGFTNEAKIFDESITVSARGTIGFVCLRSHPYLPIVRLISVIPQKELLSAKYLYLYLNNINISGTGSTQQQLTIPAFKITKIIIPNIDIINRFTNIVEGLFIKIETNKKEKQILTALRDTLLPKLMSGEIRVPVEVTNEK